VVVVRWPLAAAVALVGSVGVGVFGVLGRDRSRVLLVVDRHAVGVLRADWAHEPLRVSVRRGRPRRVVPDLGALGGEHGVEALGELPAAVSGQVGGCAGALAEVGRQVAGGLRRPGAVGVGGDLEDL
jgi:hypothetical protein